MLQLSSELSLSCFSDSYAAARQRFVAIYRQLPLSLQKGLQEYIHPLTGPTGEILASDVAYLGQREQPQQLLVLISATHGVEGFAGSAIQADCLPLLAEVLAQNESLGAVIIHALNPWGFAWLRRYDHEGIDLNRNFIDFSKPLPDNEEYEALHASLTSADLLQQTSLSGLWQATGLPAFTEVVTRGQYHHADGCFFGGSGPSWSRRMLQGVGSAEPFARAERIAVLDLHTGLGPYGYGELINDHLPGTSGDACVRRWYGANACSAQLGESVSTLKNGLLDFYWHEVIGDRGCFVTLEFGTYAADQLLTTLLQEQVYHATSSGEGKPRDLDNPHVQALRDFFYPKEASWQQQVLFRGRQAVSLAVQGLLHD